MKVIRINSLLKSVLASSILFVALCSCSSSEERSSVCIFDKASVLDAPSKKSGKWLSSVSLGEKVEFLGTKEDADNDKTFLKVKLLDGKEGWIQSDFIAVKAKPAAILEKADIYTRPDLSTISKKAFEPMDIFAIISKKDDWIEVAGKRNKGKWIDKGWIKDKGYTESSTDIAAALFINRALGKPKKELILADLKEIQGNSNLSGSVFDDKIAEIIDKLEGNNVTPAPTTVKIETPIADSTSAE